PYLLAGLLQGLLGAVLSVAMVYALHHLIIEQLSASSVLQLIFPDPAFLSWWWLSAVALTGAMIGVIGSYLAVRKFRYL
ncbi:MAG: cell division protein FtsX, partial [Proteobacteria bacterium]